MHNIFVRDKKLPYPAWPNEPDDDKIRLKHVSKTSASVLDGYVPYFILIAVCTEQKLKSAWYHHAWLLVPRLVHQKPFIQCRAMCLQEMDDAKFPTLKVQPQGLNCFRVFRDLQT